MHNRLFPPPYKGNLEDYPITDVYGWLKQLPANRRIYLMLWNNWGTPDLPTGYDYYIINYHLESVNLDWLRQQVNRISAPIIVLFDGENYNLDIPGIHFIPYIYWHQQADAIINYFEIEEPRPIKYKFSAICNRVTQSKIWSTTQLFEKAKDDSLIALNTSRFEEKDVHYWEHTGFKQLDDLTDIFRKDWFGKHIKIDDFVHPIVDPIVCANPWYPAYTETAINFTNESFHYSLMMDHGEYYWPGPFITEKTLKCLIAGTAFVPVGQFKTYHMLTKLGFEFDYGFDTSWDLDPGNLTRAVSIVNLIDYLRQKDIPELISATKNSTKHNQNWITSREFYRRCEQHNQQSIEQIFQIIR